MNLIFHVLLNCSYSSLSGGSLNSHPRYRLIVYRCIVFIGLRVNILSRHIFLRGVLSFEISVITSDYHLDLRSLVYPNLELRNSSPTSSEVGIGKGTPCIKVK